MATNLDKLKAEIAEMSAEKFAENVRLVFYADEVCDFVFCKGRSCQMRECWECFEDWLNEESEENENETVRN